MQTISGFTSKICTFLLILLAVPFCALAQTPRIRGPISDRVTVPFASVHPMVNQASDAGPLPANRVLQHLKLVLRRDPAQQAAFDAYTAALQDPNSPLYHRWLTPEQVGTRFGIAQQDLNQVSNWLRAQGLTIDEVSPGGWVIQFSGTVAQVQAALHTELHFIDVNGERHYANVSAPRIPQALAPVVSTVFPLHDFRKRPALARVAKPNLKNGPGNWVIQPADFAKIYNLNPLYSSGIDGTGQTVAIVSECPIDVSFVGTFRSSSGLSQNNPTVQLISPIASTPCSAGEDPEPYLDVEWAGAVAKGANILMVVDDNIDDSALYIVQHNVAAVVSTSYGICESDAQSTGEDQFWNLLWQQAASQGITSMVSSGDAGAAGCSDPHSTARTATGGLQVNAICSSPYSICVGGTQFNEGTSAGQYWSATGSALGYIPETSWNESGTVAGGSGLWASGGGYSTIYATPSWQTASNSNPQRGVPDVSLTAAGHDGYYEIDDQCALCIASGTSASSPAFAGMMAMVVQKTGQRQGNANPLLYSLAATSGVFHDITTGNNNVPGLTGYAAGPGWDAVTGLGSVDANAMVTQWPVAPSTTAPPAGAARVTLSVVTKTAPPANGSCPINSPASASSFQTSDGTAYLYFVASVSNTDILSDEWIAPDGTVYQNTWWPAGQGTFCFPDDSLSLGALTAAQSGNWNVKIYDNGTQVASVAFSISVQSTTPVIPQTGWWWDPNLSGEGFFIEYGGGSGTGIFMAGFLSNAAGNPTWLASIGSMKGSTYAGNWLSASGGQALLGPYYRPTLVTASSVSITFTDPSHGVLTRPDGTQVNIQRYGFSAGAVAPPEAGTAQVGWWWGGPSLSGTGYAVEFQGNNVFIAGYVYDSSGNPIWYLATGTLTSPTQYSGTWDSYVGGPQLTSPEGTYPSHKSGSLTPMTLNFSDATHGTMTMGTVSVPIVRYQQF